eukprot:scaffold67_cov80-Cylindrotheca_fusiformis.AAC.2
MSLTASSLPQFIRIRGFNRQATTIQSDPKWSRKMITVPLPPPDGLLFCPDLSANELANELEVDPQQIVLFL